MLDNCDGKIQQCIRCTVSYCHSCYLACPGCSCKNIEEKSNKNTKKCDTPGCKNISSKGISISPGTFVVVCDTCYESFSGKDV